MKKSTSTRAIDRGSPTKLLKRQVESTCLNTFPSFLHSNAFIDNNTKKVFQSTRLHNYDDYFIGYTKLDARQQKQILEAAY